MNECRQSVEKQQETCSSAILSNTLHMDWVYHETHMIWPYIEPGSSRWDMNVKRVCRVVNSLRIEFIPRSEQHSLQEQIVLL